MQINIRKKYVYTYYYQYCYYYYIFEVLGLLEIISHTVAGESPAPVDIQR